jgi:hypothetical protein
LFPTDALPVSADLLSHVLHQLQRRGRIEHRYLRLPLSIDGVDIVRLYADMARLSRFSGVVLDGSLAPQAQQSLLERLRYHQPAVKLGALGAEPAPPGADFQLVELEAAGAAALSNRAPAHVPNGTPAFFLIRRTPATRDAQLYDTMRALRAAGIRHYGYTNDDFLADSPSLLRTVTELRAHTVVPAEAPGPAGQEGR